MIFLPNILFLIYFLLCSYIPRIFIYSFTPSELNFLDNQDYSANTFIFTCLFCFLTGTTLISFNRYIKNLLFYFINKIDNFFLKLKLQNSALIFLFFCVILSLYPILKFASSLTSLDTYRSSGNQGYGILTIWTGLPILFSSLYLIILKLKNLKSNWKIIIFSIPILLISSLPSIILSNRSIIFVWAIAILFMAISYLNLNTEKIRTTNHKFNINKKKKIIYLFFLIPLIILLTITFTRIRAGIDDPLQFLKLVLRVDGLSALERIVEYISSNNKIFGDNLSSIIIEPLTILIPRTIWPTKPIPLSIEMTQQIFSFIFLGRGWEISGNEGGVSATLFGEILFAGGYLISYLFSFIWGIYGTFLGFLLLKSNSYFTKTILAFLIGFFVFSAESYTISMNAAVSLLIPIASICTISIFIYRRNY